AAGISQKALAEKVGFATSAIGHLEQGLRKPSWATVLALAEALGVDSSAFAQEPERQPAEASPPPTESAAADGLPANRRVTQSFVVNGQMLRDLQARRRLSQKQLAARSGCSARTIRKALHGEPVSEDTIRALARALGVTVSALLRDAAAQAAFRGGPNEAA